MERIAHRGAKREFAENTIPAFRRAFERGADGVELDVHATRDGVVVVHHDPTVRLDPRHGSAAIASLTWAELERVDLGGGARIPRLDEALVTAPAGATVYVEIKGAGIEHRVAEVILAASARCAVHSFDHAAVRRMREIAPDVPRGVLFERSVPLADLAELVRNTGARDVWPEWKLIDERMVESVHELGGRVLAWTVNATEVAASLAAMGVDGVCGDDVRVFDAMPR